MRNVTPRGRKPRKTREDRLREKIVEALRWLDVQAPGRAHNALTEALNSEPCVTTHGPDPFAT